VKLGAIISKMACINVSADEISDIIKDVSNGNLTTLLLFFSEILNHGSSGHIAQVWC